MSYDDLKEYGSEAAVKAAGKLKRFKRLALRCEKTKQNFASIVALAASWTVLST